MIYLARQHTGLSNGEIGRLLGGMHYSAVNKASARLKEEMTEDRKLSRLIEELDSQFKT